jgi:hypothetical protein
MSWILFIQKSMQEKYWMQIEGIFEQDENERDLLASMRELTRNQCYSESLQVAMRDAIALIELLKSLNLSEARRKMFTDKYLFMSHEFNILNMLLSSRE